MNGLTASLEGLQRAEMQMADSAKRLSRLPAAFNNLLASTGTNVDSSASVPVDIVDISAETIVLMTARTAAQANISAIETYDQVQQAIVGMFR